jgi:hypothetical protein
MKREHEWLTGWACTHHGGRAFIITMPNRELCFPNVVLSQSNECATGDVSRPQGNLGLLPQADLVWPREDLPGGATPACSGELRGSWEEVDVSLWLFSRVKCIRGISALAPRLWLCMPRCGMHETSPELETVPLVIRVFHVKFLVLLEDMKAFLSPFWPKGERVAAAQN